MTTKKQTGLLMSIRQAKRKNRKKKILSISSIISMLVIFSPTTAFAYESDRGIWDVGGKISDAIAQWLLDSISTLFEEFFLYVSAAADTTYISGTFSNLFDSRDIYSLVETVHSVAVIPLAESILALFMLVQLVKISQRIDATATLPTVKDIVFLAVTYVIFHWAIVNSLEIISDIFDEFNKLVTSINGTIGNVKFMDEVLDLSSVNLSKVNIGNAIVLFVSAFLCWVTGLVSFIISLVMAMARAVQLYVMAAFAPIPLSLLGFEETRQSGISFVKNFCAVCLSGAIMMFLFVAYPMIVVGSISATGMGNDSIIDLLYGAETNATASGTNLFIAIASWLALSLLMCIGLVKSGAWAKEILGS
ncbi:TPA: hypothetical protein TVH00_000833 [Streptococcus equi subsp. zooepidemicus]|nr:hypothetical protein [Streptococcus equi subsp. zooepidemicus]